MYKKIYFISVIALIMLFIAKPVQAADSAVFTDPSNLGKLATFPATLVNTSVWVSGGIFVIMAFIGAIKYAMAQGDPKGLEGAKQTLTQALFGFLIILGFLTIINIIVSNLGLSGDVEQRILEPGNALESGLNDFKELFKTDEYTSTFTPTPEAGVPKIQDINKHEGNAPDDPYVPEENPGDTYFIDPLDGTKLSH